MGKITERILVSLSVDEIEFLLDSLDERQLSTPDVLYKNLVTSREQLLNVNGAAQEVFAHWQKVHKKEKSRLDKKRLTRIKNMLRFFSVDELKQAINGALKDDWLMGRGKAPRAYNGLETILRDVAQVERLMELGKKPVPATVAVRREIDLPEVQKGGFI
jgi:hypothetical protein